MWKQNDWQVVQYGKRRRERPPAQTFVGGMRGRKDRAPPVPFREQNRPFIPNRPVPPSSHSHNNFSRQKQYRSYASVVQGTNNNNRPFRSFQRHDNRVRQHQTYQKPDQKFGETIRKLHALIKTVHHLQSVAPRDDKEEPRMISKMVDTLSTMIKPAFPTNETMEMIVGNAINWGYTTLMVLEDHYENVLENILKDLKKDLPNDWKGAFVVATRWARKNLTRISQDSIDYAEALVTAEKLPKRRISPGKETDIETTPELQQRCTEHADIEERPALQQQHAGSKETAVQTENIRERETTQVQTRPETHHRVLVESTPERPDHRVSVATNTDEGNAEARDLEEGVNIQMVQHDTQQEQLPRRSRVRVHNPCEIQEDDPILNIEEIQQSQPSQKGMENFPKITFDLIMDETKLDTPIHSQRTISSEEEGEELEFSTETHNEDEETDHTQTPIPQSERKFRVNKHRHTDRKMSEWGLEVTKKWLIIGDSNIARMPDHFVKDLQMESYPGANFRHAQAILEKAVTETNNVEKVILSFGINSRDQRAKETAVKQMQAALRTAKTAFPFAEIWIPLINFSSDLPTKQQGTLQILNAHITRNMPFIPLLDRQKFKTENDHIHWTRETATEMLQHWKRFLNC